MKIKNSQYSRSYIPLTYYRILGVLYCYTKSLKGNASSTITPQPHSIMKMPNFIVPYGSGSGSVSIVGRNTPTPIYPHSVLCWPDRRIRVSLFTLAGPLPVMCLEYIGIWNGVSLRQKPRRKNLTSDNRCSACRQSSRFRPARGWSERTEACYGSCPWR